MCSRSEFVPIGEFRISADAGAELITVTASCVALVLYDTVHHIAGMIHLVLPGRRKQRREEDRNSFFADTGVPLLIEEMIKSGSAQKNLVATVVGGGQILTQDTEAVDIGKQNAETTESLLRENGIPIIRKDVGGKEGRRITLKVSTGDVKIEKISREQESGVRIQKSEVRIQESGVRIQKSEVRDMKSFPIIIKSLAPNPASAGLVLDKIHKSSVNWDKVWHIISRDLVLAVHFFRIANSPYYGQPKQVSSFRKALELMGTGQVRRICILAAVTRQSQGIPDASEIVKTAISHHSMTTAVICRYLAGKMPQQFQDDIFTAGLFHSIGCLSIMLQSDSFSLEWKKNYGKIGGYILSELKMPEHIINAVSLHAPLVTDEDKGEAMTPGDFLHLGCGISRLLDITTTLEPEDFRLSSHAIKAVCQSAKIPWSSDAISGIIPGVICELKREGLLEYFDLYP